MGEGQAAIEFGEQACGIELDAWQTWCVLQCLAQRITVDQTLAWSSFENAIITPRQNGKNFILEVIQLACIYLFGDMTLVHSAHKFDTSVEHFNRLKFLFEESEELSPLLYSNDRSFVTGSGKEHIRLNTSQRILFKARHRGGGRGFTGDKVFLDEAFDLPASAMGSTIPTLSTRPGAQVYYTSSGPHENSKVLHAVRRRARKNDPLDRLFYAEWGNGQQVLTLDPVEDEDEYMAALLSANPAVSAGRISLDYIRQEIRTFSGDQDLVDEHTRERLGVATMPISLENSGPIPQATWGPLGADPDKDGSYPKITSDIRIALDVTEDRKFAAFGIAGRCEDKRLQIEVANRQFVKDAGPEGTVERVQTPGDWVVPRAVELWLRYKTPIRIEKGSPAGAYISRIEAAADAAGKRIGVEVEELSTTDHAQAFGMLVDEASAGRLRHLHDAFLTAAVKIAVPRLSGDASLWSRKASKGDICTLVACTLALGGVPIVEESTDNALFVFHV